MPRAGHGATRGARQPASRRSASTSTALAAAAPAIPTPTKIATSLPASSAAVVGSRASMPSRPSAFHAASPPNTAMTGSPVNMPRDRPAIT
jgi:hypothetical protein